MEQAVVAPSLPVVLPTHPEKQRTLLKCSLLSLRALAREIGSSDRMFLAKMAASDEAKELGLDEEDMELVWKMIAQERLKNPFTRMFWGG